MNTDTSHLTDRLPATATGTITHHLSEDVDRSLDSNDPAVRRVVYNLYRGLLGTYNDKANCMLSALPPERVREDQGITRQLESMVNQTTQSGGGNPLAVVKGQVPTPSPSMASSTGNAAPPLPPPLPTGGLPSVRINSEVGPAPSVNHGYGSAGAKHMPGGGSPFSYIPPSAIQNAMMTKDKKPFTYTPGGLDLSEIRSPRMVRRISKNAMDEGVASCPMPTSPPSSGALSPLYLPPQAVAAMQPQLAVPVFPPTSPPPPPPPPPSVACLSPNYVNFPPPPAPLLMTSPYEEKFSDGSSNCPRSPSPPPPPPPSSHFSERTAQLGSIYIPPVTSHNGPTSPPVTAVQPSQLSKTPMPWMNSQNRMQSQSPPLFAPSPSMVKQGRTFSDTEDPLKPVTQSQVRIIPLHIEGRDSPPAQQIGASLNSNLNTNMNKSNGTTRVVPIQLEADVTSKPVHYLQQNPPQPYSPPAPITAFANQTSPQSSSPARPAFVPQPPWRTNSVNNSADSANSTFQNLSLTSPPPTLPSETRNPIQSRSFRILQMITDAEEINAAQEPSCNNNDTIDSGRLSRASVSSGSSGGTLGRTIPGERRLELTQDDQQLMNLFKTKVSEDSYLHTEADPRYRGSHIPSRAFRCLQNFTDTSNTNGTTSSTNSTRVTHHAPVMAQTMRQGEAMYRPSGPPSEQAEPEPRKYMGGNIPSRSFRILQAMTATDPPVQDDDGYVSQASEVNSPEDQIASSKIPSPLKHTIPHFAQKNRPISFAEELAQVCQNPVLRGTSSKVPSRLFRFLQESFDPTTSGAEATKQTSTPDIIVQAYDRIEQVVKMEPFDEKEESKTINASFKIAKPPSNDVANESQVLNSTSTQPPSGHSCLLSYFCSHSEPPSSVVSPVRSFSPSLLFQEMVFPASEEGKHLRVRSKRSRGHIPSRIFKFLQSEYDQDADPDVGSPPTPLSQSSSRFSLALDSFLPDTNSSGASEIEGFMGH